ncbi:MAG: acyl carrier protein [Myxococcales bacterium]|nr:acyl carrier protein [Myxococcales bacterium]
MTRDALQNRLIELAAKRFERDASTLSATDDFFEKLGIDSFQAMELMTDLEEEFDIEIPDYELQGVNTLAKLAEVIEPRL